MYEALYICIYIQYVDIIVILFYCAKLVHDVVGKTSTNRKRKNEYRNTGRAYYTNIYRYTTIHYSSL